MFFRLALRGLVVQKDIFPATFNLLLGGSSHLVSRDRNIPIYKPWISAKFGRGSYTTPLWGLIYSHQGFFHHVSGTSVMGGSSSSKLPTARPGSSLPCMVISVPTGPDPVRGSLIAHGFVHSLCTSTMWNKVWFPNDVFFLYVGFVFVVSEPVVMVNGMLWCCVWLGWFFLASPKPHLLGEIFSAFRMWISEIFVGKDFSAQKLNPFPPKKNPYHIAERTPQDPMVNGNSEWESTTATQKLHLWFVKPYENIYINWCRISSINSIIGWIFQHVPFFFKTRSNT